jgi:hypothetical protein
MSGTRVGLAPLLVTSVISLWSFGACGDDEEVPSPDCGPRDRCFSAECSPWGNRCGSAEYDLCEPIADECYPSNGRCRTQGDCPRFSWEQSVDCGLDGFCHVLPADDARPILDDADLLSVSPLPDGNSFANTDDIEFSWEPQPGPVIAVVTVTRPLFASDLAEPLWAAFLEPYENGVRWEDGAAPNGESWAAPPSNLPGGTLYFTAVAYEGLRVTRISPTLLFRVGESWPELGAPCSADPQYGLDCASPGEPRTCYQLKCERPCLSHVDCQDIGDGRCGDPVLGIGRLCGIYVRDTASGEGGTGGTDDDS